MIASISSIKPALPCKLFEDSFKYDFDSLVANFATRSYHSRIIRKVLDAFAGEIPEHNGTDISRNNITLDEKIYYEALTEGNILEHELYNMETYMDINFRFYFTSSLPQDINIFNFTHKSNVDKKDYNFHSFFINFDNLYKDEEKLMELLGIITDYCIMDYIREKFAIQTNNIDGIYHTIVLKNFEVLKTNIYDTKYLGNAIADAMFIYKYIYTYTKMLDIAIGLNSYDSDFILKTIYKGFSSLPIYPICLLKIFNMIAKNFNIEEESIIRDIVQQIYFPITKDPIQIDL